MMFPLIFRSSGSCGIAAISFDFSPTSLSPMQIPFMGIYFIDLEWYSS